MQIQDIIALNYNVSPVNFKYIRYNKLENDYTLAIESRYLYNTETEDKDIEIHEDMAFIDDKTIEGIVKKFESLKLA